MPVIDTAGLEIEDVWRFIDTADVAIAEDYCVMTLDVFEECSGRFDSEQVQRRGVRFHVGETIDDAAPYVRGLGLIELEFPHFKDGRMYSMAAMLRRKLGFTGDLRACGDVLPDQALFLVRSGFSSIVVPEQFSPAQFQSSLSAYSVAYQSGQSGDLPMVLGLHRSEPSGVTS